MRHAVRVAVHDELTRLAAAAGSGVFQTPEGFRAAFDDFVDEGSASPGELALLTDAIGTGAFRRLLDQLDLGAAPSSAITGQAHLLASARGTTETEGAAWALAVLAHALGRVDAAEVLRHRRTPQAPVVAPAPPGPPPPPPGTPPLPPSSPSPRAMSRSRRLPLALAVTTVLLLVSGVVAVVLVSGGDDDEKRADDAGATESGVDAAPQVPTDDERAAAQRFAEDAAVDVVEVQAARYDAEVDEAADLMTESFAASYRTTAGSLRQDFVDRKVNVTAEAVGNGLIGIDDERASVLVFLNQEVRRRGENPSSSPYRVVVVLARDADGWLVDDLRTDGAPELPAEPDPDRQAVLTAATATAEALVNLDHHDAQASVDAVLATATGTFAEQYESSSADVVKLAREAHSVMTGTVKAAGISSIDADSARVVVATTGEVSNDSTGSSPRENNYRMQLDLILVDGEWLTSDLQFVS